MQVCERMLLKLLPRLPQRTSRSLLAIESVSTSFFPLTLSACVTPSSSMPVAL